MYEYKDELFKLISILNFPKAIKTKANKDCFMIKSGILVLLKICWGFKNRCYEFGKQWGYSSGFWQTNCNSQICEFQFCKFPNFIFAKGYHTVPTQICQLISCLSKNRLIQGCHNISCCNSVNSICLIRNWLSYKNLISMYSEILVRLATLRGARFASVLDLSQMYQDVQKHL